MSDDKLIARLRFSALDSLGRREHSRRELATKLSAKFDLPVNAPELQVCLDKLAADGYQSDERFAEIFVRSRRARGYGPLFIEQELRQRGITADLITAVVNRSDAEWLALAGDQKRKKFGVGHVTALNEKAKVIRFLRYRGFLQPQVDAALQSY
ncbi:MAG TPA: regulatory protein RecX [Pseudomonadales bacterium]|nr:regulatory protein RecX [Pseudomonadales bacterium]